MLRVTKVGLNIMNMTYLCNSLKLSFYSNENNA